MLLFVLQCKQRNKIGMIKDSKNFFSLTIFRLRAPFPVEIFNLLELLPILHGILLMLPLELELVF